MSSRLLKPAAGWPPALILLLVAGVSCGADHASWPESIVFAVRQPGAGGHWYENFGYDAFDENRKLSGAQGRLCRLELATGDVEVLLEDLQGAVRDPQVHYDGRTILFSYRPGGEEHFHLYELDIDSGRLGQLTFGPYDDLEPTYLPDGHILFCSSRCQRWVPCWYTPVAVLYRCDADGSNVQSVSANVEHDNTPWPMPDGRVLYERWEYVDRSRVSFHHLWTSNPDGTGQMVFYGNMHPGTLMIDAKPIPGSDQVLAVFSPNHGKREHAGAIAIVTPRSGPDDLGSARSITQSQDYRDPFPVTRDAFLVARGAEILRMDRRGETERLYRLPAAWIDAGAEVHEPRPLVARTREPVIPIRNTPQVSTGRLFLQDVYHGRRMEGVARGEIKKLLILETLPKPVNDSGKMPPISFGGTYMLERILGTVDVAPDGSAYFQVPALRPLFFVALDAQNNSVKRMHSFLTVMPGETTGCVGCHEPRTSTPRGTQADLPSAIRSVPQRITPLADIPEVFDFPRDIQPILDRHCTRCHDYDRRDGGLVLTGDHGPVYSHSYYTLTALGYVSDGRDRVRTNLPPRSVGSSASPLMQLIDGSHYDARLSAHEQDLIRYWIESAAAYPGTYAALGTGMIGGYPKSRLDTSDEQWPESAAAAAAIARRCDNCHAASQPLPKYLSDDQGFVLSNPDFDDIRVRRSRHLLFNLSRPEKSLMLLAPLARAAGGLQLCEGAVFDDTSDPDYQDILALCRRGREQLAAIGRFDMPAFRPSRMYVREMQRYGILDDAWDGLSPIDVYATDRRYWESLWYREPQQE
jgi:hypothetical protein